MRQLAPLAMLSSASTQTKQARQSAFRPSHQRQRSTHVNEVQDANAAGRPFQFMPKRRSSSGSGTSVGTKVSPAIKDHDETPATCYDSPKPMEVSLSEATAGDQPTPSEGTPRPLFTFPRARTEKAHCPLPEFDDETRCPDTPIPPLTPRPKGALHLDLDIGRRYAAPTAAFTQTAATASIADTAPRPASAGPTAAFSTALVRKKSGELVKPSLKPPATSAFNTWSASGRVRTKSAPATPVGPKFVHFDAQLEHVKLFLAEQKPLAVSRGGSPTETSEGETDSGYPFPSVSLPLRLRILALPPALPAESVWTFDVRLEKAMLEDTTLVGHVIVRNVAFAKWVAVRFTLDAWQTTSEVAARHIASLRDGLFDRFEFRVRLGDYLSGIEAKRLIWCVRYSVEGQEMWDSNGGRNYEVGFERVKEEPQRKNISAGPAVGMTPQTRRAGLESMADLRKQLEKVVRDGQDVDGPLPLLTTALHRNGVRRPRVWIGNRHLGDDVPSPPRSRSLSPLKRNVKDGEAATPSLRDADAPLSARYDFDLSLKSPVWTPPPPSQHALTPSTAKPKKTRARARSPPAVSNSVPAVQPSGAGDHRRSMSIPVDAGFTFRPVVPLPRGSPRDSADFADERAEEHHRLSRGQDVRAPDGAPRRHARAWAHRSSYADRVADEPPALLRTPPSTPTVTAPTPPSVSRGLGFRLTSTSGNSNSSGSESSCSPSLSPSGSSLALDAVWGALHAHDADSLASTPSTTTSASSPSLSPQSPQGQFLRTASDESLAVSAITGMSRAKRPPVDSMPYHSFVDQCVLLDFLSASE